MFEKSEGPVVMRQVVTLCVLEGVDDRVLIVMAEHADVCSVDDASRSS